jgi:dTDP-4-dehydrorhamnose 3,5-epimerase-like enzyme
MLSQIDGVYTYPYTVIPDERGRVHKLVTPPFVTADTYVTTVRENAIKAWHGYKTKSLRLRETCLGGWSGKLSHFWGTG